MILEELPYQGRGRYVAVDLGDAGLLPGFHRVRAATRAFIATPGPRLAPSLFGNLVPSGRRRCCWTGGGSLRLALRSPPFSRRGQLPITRGEDLLRASL